MIWTDLLVWPEPIKDAHKLIGKQGSLMKSGVPVLGLHAGILQTLGAIYHETMPLLYQDKCFAFSSPAEIGHFGYHRLREARDRRAQQIFEFQTTLNG